MKFWKKYGANLLPETVVFHVFQSAIEIGAKSMPKDVGMARTMLFLPHDVCWFELNLEGRDTLGIYAQTDDRPHMVGWTELHIVTEKSGGEDTQTLIQYEAATGKWCYWDGSQKTAPGQSPPDVISAEDALDVLTLFWCALMALNTPALHERRPMDFTKVNKARAAKGKPAKPPYTEIRVSETMASHVGRGGGTAMGGALVRRYVNWYWTGKGRQKVEPRVIEPHTRNGGSENSKPRRLR